MWRSAAWTRHSNVPYKAEVEAHRLTTLKGWIAERVTTAKYFAALPPTYPFASTQGKSAQSVGVDAAVCIGAFATWAPFLAQAAAEKAWYQAKLPPEQPRPDAYWAPLALGWLDANAITLFETPKDVASRDANRGEEMHWELTRGNVHVTWADAARTRPRFVYYWEHHVGEEREAYDYKLAWLLVYDGQGHLAQVYQPHMDPIYGNGQASLRAYTWEGGKVTRVVETDGPVQSAHDSCHVKETRF